MIKSNELRLGSIIDFDGMKSIVKEIDNQGVVVFIKETDETEWIDLFQFTPIPLTEEVLLKCGFEQKDHFFRLHLVNSIYIEFNSECNLWHFDIYMNTSRIELQYLHELQNIYSSITFKELEINL